ncbi:hypothetical protein [Saliterribacillus persicus]|uniref:Uncharacterized protein n=1 Tax=Saliterribacillus persicus TaxID=930114 RepID=A0A368X3Q2_9BACI|nr:hypothetical protein [Saliterribacillus persicus]RCW62563.1 hypothetical protein DFR57_1256 [Saliterribacillus persicus]
MNFILTIVVFFIIFYILYLVIVAAVKKGINDSHLGLVLEKKYGLQEDEVTEHRNDLDDH